MTIYLDETENLVNTTSNGILTVTIISLIIFVIIAVVMFMFMETVKAFMAVGFLIIVSPFLFIINNMTNDISQNVNEVTDLANRAVNVKPISLANSPEDVLLRENSKHYYIDGIIFENKQSSQGLLILTDDEIDEYRYFEVEYDDPVINLLNKTNARNAYVYEEKDGAFIDVVYSDSENELIEK